MNLKKDYSDIKWKENGKLKTVEELYEEAKELIVDELDCMRSELY